MRPKSLRLSQESKIILEITINNMMHRKVLKNMIIELRSPKKWRNLVNLGQKEYGILKYQRRPTSNRRCISTIPWKTLQILISKMECYKRCWLTLYVQKASTKSDAIVVQERETSAQLTQVDRKESLRTHSSEGQKALRNPDAMFSSESTNLMRNSVFRNDNPSNLRGSLLEDSKDHLLNQTRSDLTK